MILGDTHFKVTRFFILCPRSECPRQTGRCGRVALGVDVVVVDAVAPKQRTVGVFGSLDCLSTRIGLGRKHPPPGTPATLGQSPPSPDKDAVVVVVVIAGVGAGPPDVAAPATRPVVDDDDDHDDATGGGAPAADGANGNAAKRFLSSI